MEHSQVDDVYTESGRQLLALLDEAVNSLQSKIVNLEDHLVHMTGMARYEIEREYAVPQYEPEFPGGDEC